MFTNFNYPDLLKFTDIQNMHGEKKDFFSSLSKQNLILRSTSDAKYTSELNITKAKKSNMFLKNFRKLCERAFLFFLNAYKNNVSK